MDDETLSKMIALGIILCLIGIFFIYQNTTAIKKAAVNMGNCNEVVDMIYEQCGEEEGINITTIKGRNTELTYNQGVCIIK